MAKVLVIKAHPLTAAESRSVKVMETFLEKYQEINPTDEIQLLDLYQADVPEIDEDIAGGMIQLRKGTAFDQLSPEQQEKMTRFDSYTQQFMDADKIVIANPLWNLNIPGRLKNWFDTVAVAGKTFRYTEAGPVGLSNGKTALHIQANGGHYQGQDTSAQYVLGILKFLGVDSVHQLFIEGIDHHPEMEKEIMAANLAKAQELATTF